MRDTFIKTFLDYARTDPSVFLITGDLGFKVLDQYREELPDQFLNIGIAEQNMAGVATGMALEGRKVFIYSIGNFPVMRCMEHIRNDIAYHNVDVKIVSVGGGFSYGPLGMSHHTTEDLSVMRAIPNMVVTAPGDVMETEEVTKYLVSHNGPGYLRLDKSLPDIDTREMGEFHFGKARVLRNGSDVTLVCTGGMLAVALRAVDILEESGVGCRLLSMHSIKPLDSEALFAAAKEIKVVITLEENVVEGGLGGAVSEVYLEEGIMPKMFYRIGLRNEFCTKVGSQGYLRGEYGMDAAAIVRKVQELMS